MAKKTPAPLSLGNAAETLTKTVIPASAAEQKNSGASKILWFPENLQKPCENHRFPLPGCDAGIRTPKMLPAGYLGIPLGC